jgi:hypothetical protein
MEWSKKPSHATVPLMYTVQYGTKRVKKSM